MPSRSSPEDPQSGDASKNMIGGMHVAHRESFPNDLDALDRTTRSAHVATPSSSVGAPAIPSPAHAAIDGTQPRSQARPLVMEPSRPARTVGIASGSSCQRATSSTAVFVPSLAGIHRPTGSAGQQHPQARRLLTHPGVGPITALATEVFLGDPKRFSMGKRWRPISG
jgi:hypothetical protein